MKFLLVAVYVAHGSSVPQVDYRAGLTKETCRVKAERYVKSPMKGHARAFCVPLREENRS